MRDAATRTLRLYVDGNLILEVSDSTTGPLTAAPTQTWIGRRYWCGDTNSFSGTIDEVAVYRAPLSLDEVRKHCWLGKGNATPSVQMNALPSSSSANPLTIGWTRDAVTAAAIISYTLTYQINKAAQATLTTLTRDANGNLPTSVSLYVGDNTQYGFKVQATSYTGTSGPLSSLASTHSSLPSYATNKPDDDSDLVDPTAELPCFPLPSTNPNYPNYSALITTLLLSQSLCNAQQEEAPGQQIPPINNLLCPGLHPHPGSYQVRVPCGWARRPPCASS